MRCAARCVFGVLLTISSLGTALSDCDVSQRTLGVSYTANSINFTKSGCDCTKVSCVRKCCELGYSLSNKTCVLHPGPFEVPLYEGTDVIHGLDVRILVGMVQCKHGFFKLDPVLYPDDAFFVQGDGQLWQPQMDETTPSDQFCLDNFGEDELSALVCFPNQAESSHISQGMNAVGMIISMPFLLATFFVYAILPDRNLHGKSLMCYVISLFGAYFILVFIQLYPDDFSDFNCKTLGILCLFFFMVSFFWMNVMSIDIWWAFSGLRGFSGSKKEAERKRFLLYCVYAWGMPLLHVVIVSSLTLSNSLPRNAWYNPSIGDGQCWFREGEPTLLYFYGPMALIILGNITLFCITAWKIKQVQQDTAMLRKDESKKHSYENDKQRFNLYLKLMLAMGVNWVMEIISWAVNWRVGHVPPGVWYLTDFCNALYGVFIFFIFVFKRNIWKLLKRRYYMLLGKPHLARSMTQTAYSPRTTGSTLSQTVTTEKSFVNDSSVLTSEVA